ncbi:response regulator receiver modulated diguanylate cyclase [Singulisphaera sp. GP187]|uniref:diguanylate cyclase n=1 Tax=Singulisphaera sp. GP187 TaxID=1882752 RepID=UPI00092630BC|nr:diguanylate cyclase [Singulisphaera sp. GP187]SIN84373.1 response regulator receiver modulated diguanylate cyclase [Singulisphaera sp. GP187]
MKILVADDESTPALFLRRTLERLGHEVVVASNGLEAWERLQADAFRLVITDWMMPGLDGLDLCRRIRGRGDSSYIYIILLTAREGLQDRLAGLTAGADDFLSKPMDPAELAARVGIAGRIVAMQEELERKNVQLAELATTDGLTGLKNRRCFDEALTTACSFAVRCGYPLSLMMFDVDHFKTLNDSFGHPAGDSVLATLAEILRSETRDHDVVARYGGEEFTVLLPATVAEEASQLADRLRMTVRNHPWSQRAVTVSAGVATTGADLATGPALLEAADRALYHSKRSGRDRVTHHDSFQGEIASSHARDPMAL